MDELATKLVDSLTKVENALETLAPEAFGYLISAAMIEGWVGLTWILVAGAGFVFASHMCWQGAKAENARFDAGIGRALTGGIAAVFLGAATLIAMFGQATWLKLINPTAYVVKSLLNQ